MDIVDFRFKIMLGNGIEFVFPVENPFNVKVMLEVGCGGDVIGNDAWVECKIPRLRLWITHEEAPVAVKGNEKNQKQQQQQSAKTSTKTQVKAYAAFIGRPDLKPNVHVNADRGRGDFFDMVLDEQGTLDDVVESILMGFGPKEYYSLGRQQHKSPAEDKRSDIQRIHSTKQSWVGNALGKQLSRAIGSLLGVGNNRPLEVDLTEVVRDAIDTALGKPRPVTAVEADIESLQKELKESKIADTTNGITSSDGVATEESNIDNYVSSNSKVAENLKSKILDPFTVCCGGA